MTKKNDTKKQPLQSFKAFGIEASVWPPNSEYGETEPKIRIGRGYRDKDGVFRGVSVNRLRGFGRVILQTSQTGTFPCTATEMPATS